MPATGSTTDPPDARENTALTDAQRQALETAVDRADPVAFESIVIAAIARSPDTASRIIREAVAIAPFHAKLIANGVESAFPGLRERAEVAVREELEALNRVRTDRSGEPRKAARRDEPDSRWAGKFSLGGTHRSSASRFLGVNFSGEVLHEIGRWRSSMDVRFDFERSEGETKNRRFRTRARTERALTGHSYAFALLDYEDHRFSGFDYQVTESVGGGYRVVDTGSFTWDLELGPSSRQSRISATGQVINELFLRGGSEMTWTISDTAELSNETSVLYNGDTVEIEISGGAGFHDSDEVTNVTALDMMVISNLAARISTEFNYTSDPPPGGRKTETLSKIALVRRF